MGRRKVQGRQLELSAQRVRDVRKEALPHEQPKEHAPYPALAVQPCTAGQVPRQICCQDMPDVPQCPTTCSRSADSHLGHSVSTTLHATPCF